MHSTTDRAAARREVGRAAPAVIGWLTVLGIAVWLPVTACALGPGAQGPTRGARADFPYHTYPETVRDDCQIVVKRCTKCHTLDRILVARVESREHWKLYAERMRRMPGSGISRADVTAAVNCLAYRSSLEYGGERPTEDSP